MPFPNEATQFRDGNPGGPGRPKGRTIETILRERLEADRIAGKAIPDGRTVADVFADVVIREALKGNARFALMLMERAWGKVAQALQHEGELTIRVEYEDAVGPAPEAPPETG